MTNPTSFDFPVPTFSPTYVSRPKAIPSLMLKASGIARMVMNAGAAFSKSLQVKFRKALHHKHTHDYQGGRRRHRGNDQDQRGEEQGQNKTESRSDYGQSGSSTGFDSCRAFNVARDGRGAKR